MGKKVHNPSHAVALGEPRKASRSGAGWWALEKPSSPTPCLCKQTLVGPFSAPGTSLRNTGDWLQLFLGGQVIHQASCNFILSPPSLQSRLLLG
jgi:hypothetical protein